MAVGSVLSAGLGVITGLPLAEHCARRGYEHWNRRLVLAIGLAEIDKEIAFFELRTDNDPCGPKHVEEELVGREARSRPDEYEREQVKRMTYIEIGTTRHEGRGGRRGSTQGCLECKRSERVKPAEGVDPPSKASDGEQDDSGREPTNGSLKAEKEGRGRLPEKDEGKKGSARRDRVESRIIGVRD